MGEERKICCVFAFDSWGKSFGSSSISQCGSWWAPGAFPVSDSISSSALALALPLVGYQLVLSGVRRV